MKSTIWFKEHTTAELAQRLKGTMAEYLGIEIVEIGSDYLKGTMPLSERTRQPIGLMHGGANVVLAETLGSVAGNMVIDRTKMFCVGQEINANHVRSIREGKVTGIATLEYKGGTSHVWSIRLYDDQERITCISRLTVAVLPVRKD